VTAEQLDLILKQAQDAGWSHLEFLHRLLADQAGLRRQRRIERLIKEARFREALPLSTFDWSFNPAIPRMQIEALAQGDFIRRQQNVVFVGQSGLGKSRLIQSIGLAACMLEHRVYYMSVAVWNYTTYAASLPVGNASGEQTDVKNGGHWSPRKW